MHQKTQWTVAAVLAVGALLAAGARPAEAQVRVRLKGPVTSPIKTGIVVPPGSQPAGIIIPGGNPAPAQTPAPAQVNTPKPAGAPVVVPPAPKPVAQAPKPVAQAPAYQSAPQGFSAGPSVLGVPRVKTGRVVNRVGPDINGDGWSDIHKDHRSK